MHPDRFASNEAVRMHDSIVRWGKGAGNRAEDAGVGRG